MIGTTSLPAAIPASSPSSLPPPPYRPTSPKFSQTSLLSPFVNFAHAVPSAWKVLVTGALCPPPSQTKFFFFQAPQSQ